MASNAFLWCVSVCLCVCLRLGTNNPFSTSSPQWLGAGYLTVEIWDGFLKLAGKISKIFFFFACVCVFLFSCRVLFWGTGRCDRVQQHTYAPIPSVIAEWSPKKESQKTLGTPLSQIPVASQEPPAPGMGSNERNWDSDETLLPASPRGVFGNVSHAISRHCHLRAPVCV